MDELKKLTTEYTNPASDRIQIIKQIEFVEDDDKWSFLGNIASDKNAVDQERIEVLRIIEVTNLPQKYLEDIIDTVYVIASSEQDEEVRNYAVVAMKNFYQDKRVMALAKKIILDEGEDLDIRWNALDVLKNNTDSEEFKEVVDRLRDTEEFGKALERLSNS